MDKLFRSALLLTLITLGAIAGAKARLAGSQWPMKPPPLPDKLFALLHPKPEVPPLPPAPPPPPAPLYSAYDVKAAP